MGVLILTSYTVITFIIFLQRPKFISSLHPRSSGANCHNGYMGAAGEIMLLVLKNASLFWLVTWHQIKVIVPGWLNCCVRPIRHSHPLFHFDILMLMRKFVRIGCIDVDLARMSPIRCCWLQCHYSLHQWQLDIVTWVLISTLSAK